MPSLLTRPVTFLLAPARYGLLTGFVALAVLLAVLISQYGFGMHPCTLCLWQRWPYAALLVLGFGLHYCTCKRRSLYIATILIFTAWVVSFALGFYHVGVEQHWWEFGGACSGTIYEAGVSADDLLARIKNAAVTRCDQSANFLFDISMAEWNALLSFAMIFVSGVMARRFYRMAFTPAPFAGTQPRP